MKKQVVVLIGTGSIGQAIIRRVSVGKHVLLASYLYGDLQYIKATH